VIIMGVIKWIKDRWELSWTMKRCSKCGEVIPKYIMCPYCEVGEKEK